MTSSPYRARLEGDFQRDGVRIIVGGPGYIRTWELLPGAERTPYDPSTGAELTVPEGRTEWLRLQEDEARAVYEELARYFGGTGHDTRALRADYDAERARVDKLIGNLTVMVESAVRS